MPFNKLGSLWMPTSRTANLKDKLDPLNYCIRLIPFQGPALEEMELFTLPHRLYGEVADYVPRVLTTYLARRRSVGVLLVGDKGSGKTLTAKAVALSAQSLHQMPCIIIGEPIEGLDLPKFLQELGQPCVILFDEFEKRFDKEDQLPLLTLLDGTVPTPHLFILTCNDQYAIDRHMVNRPSRLFYNISFTGLSETAIRDFCNDCLDDKTQTESIVRLGTLFRSFNFDMLQALVEEMNRYKETVTEALPILNIRLERLDVQDTHTVILTTKSNTVVKSYYPEQLSSCPLVTGTFSLHVDKGNTEKRIQFNSADLVTADFATGTYTYKKDGFTAVCKRVAPPQYSVTDFLA